MGPAILAYRTDKSCWAGVPTRPTTEHTLKDDAAVTKTNAITPSAAPVFPPGRYGRRREPRRARRWIPAVIAVVAVVAGLALALRLHQQYGERAYDAELVRYTDVTDTQVVVHFRVSLPAGKSATCTVRARNRAGVEVGRAQVPVPPGPDRRPLITYRLATSERPVSGEIQGCGPATGGSGR
jgi:hypothetical protein